jgi:hypothetical protein
MRKLLGSAQAPGVAIGVLALVIAVAGGAYAASGGGGAKKITVCVAKGDGTLYQAKKCAKKDKKLSWNQKGPAGPAGAKGAAGTNGANGANGAVQGYSATNASSVDITKKTAYTTIVTKDLPAGSYLVNGQAVLQALDTESPGQASDDTCRLLAGSAESLPVTWSSPLGGIFLFRVASGSVSMQMALTAGAATTVSLQCKNLLNAPPANWTNTVVNASITAVQTTANS